MALSPGAKLGRYEIRSQLGAGGMGEVYRARDTQLGRDVAVKVLPPGLYINSDRLQRFEQEACAASALNHPNILVVHDIGANNGAPYIVSELLEGETLRKRMAGTALGPRRAIDYALQIAQGLGAAHEKGIVHRDLKPDNIFITNDERVKIFDFGLAKLTQPDGDHAQTEIPTRRVDTDPGVVMGTAGYMSPEQVRGKTVDHRSDIFSLGAILYEMLSGRRAFHGESAADTLSAILKEDPPELSQTNKNVSPSLERLVNHCLEKNPEARFNSARDLAFALESLAGGTTVSDSQTVVLPATTTNRPKRRELIAWILAGVGLLAAALAAVVPLIRRAPDQPNSIVRYRIQPPEKLNFIGPPTISPDGSRIVVAVRDVTGRSNLWIQQRDSVHLQQLNGTEGGGQPFWSPDGRSIGFFANGKLKRIDAAGGTAQTLCDINVSAGGTWSKDGVIVFGRSPADGLYRIPATGGNPEPATKPDKSRKEISHVWPYFLPDGRHFLYLARNALRDQSTISVASLDSNETKDILNGDSSMVFAPSGHLLFVRDRRLMVQAFDPVKLQLAGEAVPIADDVGLNLSNGRAFFSVSADGMLAYRSTPAVPESRLVWVDRTGKELGTVGPNAGYSGIHLSPDNKRLALQRFDPERTTADIWLIEVTRGTPTRFTFDPATDANPIWSPDGNYIVFTSPREGVANLYRKLSNGGGNDELLLKSDRVLVANDWSPDGKYIIYQDLGQSNNFDLWVLPLADPKPVVFLQTNFLESGAQFSPDGRWVAYTSNESGRLEIYVRKFPASGGQWQVSNGGGAQAYWRRDGKELFYLSTDNKMMSVEVNGSSDTFEASIPKVLFDFRNASIGTFSQYAVSSDGQKFLLNDPIEENAPSPITVVLNWTTGLRR